LHNEGKLKLRSHNTSYCLLQVVTKAGLTVYDEVIIIIIVIILSYLTLLQVVTKAGLTVYDEVIIIIVIIHLLFKFQNLTGIFFVLYFLNVTI